MRNIQLPSLALLSVLLLSSGCGLLGVKAQEEAKRPKAPNTPLEKLDTHYDDPIIIDNPSAFIDLAPDDHDSDLFGPIDGTKSLVVLMGHDEYKYIKFSATSTDRPVKLANSEITVVLKKVQNGNEAGKLKMKWRKLSDVPHYGGLVTLESEDKNGNDKLRWERFKRNKRLGLHRKQPNEDYQIASVTYTEYGATRPTTRPFTRDTVHIRLCVEKSGAAACEFE